MRTPDYYCQACGTEVMVSKDGIVSRMCEHDGVTIIAERSCTLYGEGGMLEPTLLERAAAALRSLAQSFRGS